MVSDRRHTHVWLWGCDAAHNIQEFQSVFCVNVFATKRAMLKAWKELGDIEMLDDDMYTQDPNTIYAVWHRINGENMFQVGHRIRIEN